MHRFFIPPEWIRENRVTFSIDTAHQIRLVLRLQPGENIKVLTGDGLEHQVTLDTVSAQETSGTIWETCPARGEPTLSITLYQALTQREKFELIIQKSVELGVCAITPVITTRSLVRSWKEEDERKTQRWQKIIQEAAEQSGRGRIPVLNSPLRLDQALTDASAKHDLCLIPWEEETITSLHTALESASKSTLRSIGVFIGPEGGFDPEEIVQARQVGAVPVSLGPRILRTETAAIISLALIFCGLHEMD